ncbi:PLDc N-terminal domain-containing protein [Chengkuizengella sediminis]|uniref:PLDc N-terminal domain-containing protein n=1 Tax=Chengkuizengella sediminis TaxID=1885917 RepID=UPI001389ADB9|nr:PLDc N-terminal domain-containing protein [Chengkuizengella sediminis]NDI33861.1 hypothetical protein [Chengkuizengella sediminis]
MAGPIGFTLAFVIWIISIFMITKISKRKETNIHMLWKVIVSLFGPFGVIVYYFKVRKV